MKLFVYGSLKRGKSNHLRLTGADFLEEAVSVTTYAMHSVGAFPIIWDADAGHKVRGELFEINPAILEACDHLEGHPTFYRRRFRWFTLANGKKVQAWIYVLNEVEENVRHPINVQPNAQGELVW